MFVHEERTRVVPRSNAVFLMLFLFMLVELGVIEFVVETLFGIERLVRALLNDSTIFKDNDKVA